MKINSAKLEDGKNKLAEGKAELEEQAVSLSIQEEQLKMALQDPALTPEERTYLE